MIWMFCSKTANRLINKIHKHSLRVIYEMEDANFEDLLIKDSSWTIHENNIHTLLIEIYKPLNHISPPIVFELTIHWDDLKQILNDMIRKHYVLKEVYYGTQSQIDIKI